MSHDTDLPHPDLSVFEKSRRLKRTDLDNLWLSNTLPFLQLVGKSTMQLLMSF